MPTGPASVSASVTPQRCKECQTVQSIALPTELVADVLEYLSLNQRRTATRVSRQFYAAAWRAGLVIHRFLLLDSTASFSASLAVLRDILDHWHAGRKNLRLSLSVACVVPGHGHPNFHPTPPDYNLPGVSDILPLITAALPLLVDLSVELPDCFRHQLDEALSRPAPLLRTLELDCLLSDGPRIMPLPSNLFAGSAPQLQGLTLINVALADDAVAAFRNVSRARFIYEQVFPHVTFSRHFPQVMTLRMDYRASDEDARTPDSFDLSGLPLHKLIVDDSCFTNLLESVERSVDLSKIPNVLINGDSITWNDNVWTEDSSPLSIRTSSCLRECAEVAVIVAPAHGRWKRLLRQRELGYGEPLPIGGMPNIGARMTYLRIDTDFLRGFLELQLELPALRDIHVDVEFCDIWKLAPPEYVRDTDLPSFHAVNYEADFAPRVWSPCLALEHVTIFAFNEAFEYTDILDSRRVAFIAHALGQLERPAAERTALVLVGVEFKQPIAHTLLSEVVSEVQTRAFCGRGSREDFDGGLWEHEFSEADRV